MSGRVIFLQEEPSMKVMLAEYLPRLVPGWIQGQHFLLVPHQGKSDLDKSIPVKLKAWQEPGVRFVIVRDNDNADCIALKTRLQSMCAPSGHKTLIRLVCQELEGWYLADPDAPIQRPKRRSGAWSNGFPIRTRARNHRTSWSGTSRTSRRTTVPGDWEGCWMRNGQHHAV